MKRLCFFFLFLILSSCYPTSGADKSLAGAVLGAGWGAGAGTVVGNQFGEPTEGLLIGSAFGAGAGLIEGARLDVAESYELEEQRELDALKVQVASNERELLRVQSALDDRERKLLQDVSGAEVFFDKSKASLRLGSSYRLQRLVDKIKINPYIDVIEIHGHSDDTGSEDLNRKLSEARARTVANFLIENGISLDRIRMFSHSSHRPIASNKTEEGKLLNRRVEIVFSR